MKIYKWNVDKNQELILKRAVSFEEVIEAINNGDLLDIIQHYNQDRYSHQKILVVKIRDYVYLVPFVENKSEIFLKTIIPSRKMKKKYLGG